VIRNVLDLKKLSRINTVFKNFKAKRQQFIAFLLHRNFLKTAAFFLSFSELLTALASGYAAFALESSGTAGSVLQVLKWIIFVLATGWWATCYYDNYSINKKSTHI
jgi:hypothetical protein